MVLLIYALAYMVSFWAVMELKIPSPLWQAAYANLIATVVVYFFSKFMDNASLYGPYWGLTPILLTFYWLLPDFFLETVSVYQWILFGLVFVWGLRLTLNWLLRWNGFSDEDWRYVLLRKKSGHWYWPVSLVGTHLLPSVLIFLGILPVYFISGHPGKPQTGWFVAALVILVFSIVLEAVADFQLLKFRGNPRNKNKILRNGVWGRVQYPNYTGEILFWWGIYLYAISFRLELWRLFLGPALITFLFLVVSIPLMDKHLKERAEVKNNKQKNKKTRWENGT